MKVALNLTVICFCLFTLFSCQKELSFETPIPGTGDDDTITNPANNKLIGTWKFINMDVSTEARVEASMLGERIATVTEYSTITKNNTGTITFDGTNAKATNLSYDFDTELTVTDYLNGVKDGEFTTPFEFSVPPLSSSSKYVLIGADSMYLPEGSFFSVPDGTGGQTQGFSQPSGSKFSINGNTLLFTSSIARDTVISQNGLIYNVTQKANGVMKFEKQ